MNKYVLQSSQPSFSSATEKCINGTGNFFIPSSYFSWRETCTCFYSLLASVNQNQNLPPHCRYTKLQGQKQDCRWREFLIHSLSYTPTAPHLPSVNLSLSVTALSRCGQSTDFQYLGILPLQCDINSPNRRYQHTLVFFPLFKFCIMLGTSCFDQGKATVSRPKYKHSL